MTAGNGAIYAVRPDAYVEVDPRMGHDLSFPFNLTKRGWRCVYQPAARATEKMVPTNEGEFLPQAPDDEPHLADRDRGRDALAARLLAGRTRSRSRRTGVLRYVSPFLHLKALFANALLLRRGRRLPADVRWPSSGCSRRRWPGHDVEPARAEAGLVLRAGHGLARRPAWSTTCERARPAEWEKAEGTR